jgi:hypothetical protein
VVVVVIAAAVVAVVIGVVALPPTAPQPLMAPSLTSVCSCIEGIVK